jgi:hypothetical protein
LRLWNFNGNQAISQQSKREIEIETTLYKILSEETIELYDKNNVPSPVDGWNIDLGFFKLQHMHLNPVRAGLVEKTIDWKWSSARWFEPGRSVGVGLGGMIALLQPSAAQVAKQPEPPCRTASRNFCNRPLPVTPLRRYTAAGC